MPATLVGLWRDGREYDAEQVEFLMALDAYTRLRRRPHPAPDEVLAVAKALGYRKAARRGRLPKPPGGKAGVPWAEAACERRGARRTGRPPWWERGAERDRPDGCIHES
jgi:hypothetical protein